ncbi:TonB-dependent siderophore receptor [Neorhizobium lilium]|uniref:TonB-dependent siderophore receptor n=1 Tax=Neorhizobium lilium TaxID=2503024 RepID=A0A444LI23_9HYPH|nr:TonB-dependent siderophore receptor [Neorhizobium lilium]RWX78564.1 TonB-dependent siderophore receptor [Neorhizobium lilium]
MSHLTRSSVRTASLRAGVAMAGICAAWSAQAQSAVENTTLAPIVLQSGDDSGTGPVKGYVAKQSTTGSKTDTPLKEIPQSVSVIGREELDDRGVITKVDEALSYTPGILTQPYGSDPDTDWIYIRGFDASQTGLSLDNLPFTSTAYGNFQIDAFALERIEVLKGPASVLVGGANAGGVVNLVGKRPTDQPYFYTETGINSDGNAFGGFDISDKLGNSDTVSYRLTGKVAGGDGYVDDTNDLRGFIMPQITFAPSDTTTLNVYAYVSGLDQTHTTNGLLPYMGTVVDNPIYGKIGRDQYLGNEDYDIGRANQTMVGYEFKHEFDNGWKFTQNARYANLYKRERYVYAFDFDQTDALIGRYAEDITSRANAFNIDNRLENDFDFGGANHTVMFGIDYRYYRLDTDKYAGFPTSIDPQNPVYGPDPVLSPGTHQIVTMNQVGAYAQDQIRFGDGFIATFNGRYDYLHGEANDRNGVLTNYSSDDHAWSGRAGIAYEFKNGVTPYASVATFFSPLVGTSVDGALKPEEGEQYEAGVKYEPTWFDGMLTASVFQIDKDNYTVSIPGVGDQQLGNVRSRGFELEGKFNIDQNWKAIASYSYTDLEFTKYPGSPDMVGKTPYVVPASTAGLWLDYTVTEGALEGLGLGAGVRYRGKSWADNANTLRVGDATVFDAGLHYEKNDWKAALNVTNLFDKDYVAGCATQYFCGYGQSRTITFKLSKVW